MQRRIEQRLETSLNGFKEHLDASLEAFKVHEQAQNAEIISQVDNEVYQSWLEET